MVLSIIIISLPLGQVPLVKENFNLNEFYQVE